MTGGWGKLLVSFDGRANRAKFWLVPLIPMLLLVLFFVLAVWVTETFVGRGAGPALAMIILGVPIFLFYIVVAASITIRRLHDREMDPRLTWLFLGLPYLLLGISALLPAGNQLPVLALQAAIGIAILGLWIWYVVVCGFLRGTYGPNAHGPDPLEPDARESADGDSIQAPVRPSRPPRPSVPPRSKRITDMPEKMQGLVHTLFGFTGRLNRAQYWLWTITIGLLNAGLLFGIASYFGWWTAAGIDANSARLTAVGLGLLFLWPSLAIVVKRLNDRNRPAWLVALIVLPSWINLLISQNVGQFRFDTNTTPPAELVISLLTIVAFVYAFIELGCLRGTIGENQHGPDPVAHKNRRPASAEA